jgi:hypothetical protein
LISENYIVDIEYGQKQDPTTGSNAEPEFRAMEERIRFIDHQGKDSLS